VGELHGARACATAGSDDKLERARAQGALEVHHHQLDIAEEIKRLTNRRVVHVVIEHVGEATWVKSVRVGQLEPVIDRTFPLPDAADAHRRMEESGQFGKIVLEVP
jgi:NADPH:quinone reductase-like Zn-dependent oxidoreductase